MEKTTESWALQALAGALQAVPGRLAPEAAQQAFRLIMLLAICYSNQVMIKTQDRCFLSICYHDPSMGSSLLS